MDPLLPPREGDSLREEEIDVPALSDERDGRREAGCATFLKFFERLITARLKTTKETKAATPTSV